MDNEKIITTYEIYEDKTAIGRTTDAKLIKIVKEFYKDVPELFIENDDEFIFSITDGWLDVEDNIEEALFEREQESEVEP